MACPEKITEDHLPLLGGGGRGQRTSWQVTVTEYCHTALEIGLELRFAHRARTGAYPRAGCPCPLLPANA